MNITVRSEKVDEKNGVISLVSMFPPWYLVLKLSKKVHFLQFCADLSKKSKNIKAIYIYAIERSRCALSENGVVYYVMTYYFGDIPSLIVSKEQRWILFIALGKQYSPGYLKALYLDHFCSIYLCVTCSWY